MEELRSWRGVSGTGMAGLGVGGGGGTREVASL